MKKLIPSIEKYLLRTGKFRYYFGVWFRTRYRIDIHKLLTHYNRYRSIKEGLSPYHTFEVMYLAHGWKYEHYLKITQILLYLDLVQPVKHLVNRMDYLIINWPQPVKKGGEYAR